MALPTFTEDLDIIAALSDRPNTDDGLTASQLKAKFDIAGNKLKAFLNTLIPQLMEKPNITGMVKATAGVLSAATPGTDYQEPIIIDSAPASGSTHAVQSGGVYSALAGKAASDHNHSGVYEPVLGDEKKRRIYYGTVDAASYYSAQGLTAQTGDIYIKVGS